MRLASRMNLGGRYREPSSILLEAAATLRPPLGTEAGSSRMPRVIRTGTRPRAFRAGARRTATPGSCFMAHRPIVHARLEQLRGENYLSLAKVQMYAP